MPRIQSKKANPSLILINMEAFAHGKNLLMKYEAYRAYKLENCLLVLGQVLPLFEKWHYLRAGITMLTGFWPIITGKSNFTAPNSSDFLSQNSLT